MTDEEDINALVSKAQNGSKAAFNRLVELCYHKVYGQALRMTKSEEDAKDVAQLAWVKAWQKLHSFRGESAFTSWLYRITTFTALDLIRKRNSSKEIPSEPALLENAANQNSPSVAAPEQIRKLERQELKARINEAFAQLPEKLRSTLTLREIDGLSYDEIAQKLECKTGTVMSRLFNARKIIQKHLADLVS